MDDSQLKLPEYRNCPNPVVIEIWEICDFNL